jgi:hypothetical protein
VVGIWIRAVARQVAATVTLDAKRLSVTSPLSRDRGSGLPLQAGINILVRVVDDRRLRELT